jgi:high affinity Mn2+ porin
MMKKEESKFQSACWLALAAITMCGLGSVMAEEAHNVNAVEPTTVAAAGSPENTPSTHDKRDSTAASDSDWPQLLGAQYTWVRQRQSPLRAPYSGPLSLDPAGDISATHTVGVYFGWGLTDKLQAYFDVEKFMGAGVSGSTGLAGLTNGDVVRQGANNLKKRPYVARRYLRYVVPLSGATSDVEAAQDQVAGKEATTRLEFKIGTMALNDDFDKNRYANSTRTQFMNWALWNNGAWDFGADTRGYTNGVVAAYVSPTWSLRAGIHQMPSMANGQDLDAPLRKARAENVELTFAPNDQGTIVRLLAYRNLARMGIYRDALAVAATTGNTPDIAAQDRDGRKKYGLGVNIEQPLADDGETGVFLRMGWNNGKTETFAFTEIDSTLAAGAQLSGIHWGRADDRLGIAFVTNGLSREHRDYLAAGGTAFVLGDGALRYGREQIVEAYYRIALMGHVQLSPDFQYIRNPGMNSDRGPVKFVGFRLHIEY